MKFEESKQDFQLNIVIPVVTLLLCFVLGLNFVVAGIITIIAIFIGLSLDIVILNKNAEYSSVIVEIQEKARKILLDYDESSLNIEKETDDTKNDIKSNEKTLSEIARNEDFRSKSEPSISTEKLEITKIDDNSKFLDDIASLAENVLSNVTKIDNKANNKEKVEFDEIDEKEVELINEISGINSEFSQAITEIWKKPPKNITRNHTDQILNNPQESTKEEIKSLEEEFVEEAKTEFYEKLEEKKEIENNVEKSKSEISQSNNKEKDIDSKKISFLEFKEIIANKEIVYDCKLCKKTIKAEIDRISPESFETVSFCENNYLFKFNISHINKSKDNLHIQTIFVDSEGKYKSTDSQWKFAITKSNQNNILENFKNNELDLNKEVVMS